MNPTKPKQNQKKLSYLHSLQILTLEQLNSITGGPDKPACPNCVLGTSIIAQIHYSDYDSINRKII